MNGKGRIGNRQTLPQEIHNLFGTDHPRLNEFRKNNHTLQLPVQNDIFRGRISSFHKM